MLNNVMPCGDLCIIDLFSTKDIKGYFFVLIFRGLFIIDPKGVVRQITINDLPVGRSVDEVLRLIKAFQFVEQHGEGEY